MIRLTDDDHETVLEVYPLNGGAFVHLFSMENGGIHVFHLNHSDAHRLVGELYAEIRSYDNQERHDND